MDCLHLTAMALVVYSHAWLSRQLLAQRVTTLYKVAFYSRGRQTPGCLLTGVNLPLKRGLCVSATVEAVQLRAPLESLGWGTWEVDFRRAPSFPTSEAALRK